jgi:glycosyltransferase involved in cell wall biosynthesis
VIPARDAAETLGAAVRSALAEPDLDAVVVVDDGGNEPVLGGLGNSPGERVRVIRGPRRGAAAARNAGIAAAGSDWVAFLDADDLWCSGHIRALLERIRADPAAGTIFAGAVHRTDDGTIVNRFSPRVACLSLSDLLFRRQQPTTSATAVRRAAAEAVGGFFEGFRRPAGVEDIDLWWRIAARYTCLTQATPLVEYRVHDRRDRARPASELAELADDARLLVRRIRDAAPRRVGLRSAAEFHAMMARYWYLAGFMRAGLSETLRSLHYWPTLNGAVALGFGLIPARGRRLVREWRQARLRRRLAA